jgi:PAS domain S-box-containing protein
MHPVLDGAQITSLIAFILVCLLLVGAVAALNSAVELLPVEIDSRRKAQIGLGQLASVVETSDDAIITKDLNGIITSWNKGAERVFGYEASEVIGKPVSLLIPPDRPDEEPAILDWLRKGQRIEHYETVRVRKDGAFIDICLSVSPLADAAGTIIGASKIARDITERKRAPEVEIETEKREAPTRSRRVCRREGRRRFGTRFAGKWVKCPRLRRPSAPQRVPSRQNGARRSGH